MKPKRSGYLYSLAFEEGEFERSQALLETTLAPFASILAGAMGEGLRANLSKEIAEEWVSKADNVLKAMLSDAPPADEAVTKTMDEMQRALRNSPRLSDATIEAEIRACSEELAQLVLAHWFAELHALTLPSDGVPLNSNMLPGTRSIEAILDGLDVGAFGVTLPTVALAVRAYRDLLIGKASKEVIEFGPQLYIAFDAADHVHPFRCFGSESDARSARAKRNAAASQVARMAHDPAPATASAMISSTEARTKRLVETLRAIRQATLPAEMQGGVDLATLASAVSALMHGASLHPTAFNSFRQHGLITNYRTQQEDAQKFLVESVGLGVDIFSSGLSANMHEAKNILSARSEPIRSLLFCYANARDVKVDAAADIYAVTVAAGVECQFGRIDVDLAKPIVDSFVPEDFLQVMTSAYGVSSTTAEQLMRDSRTGTACMVSPMGEAWTDS